MTYMPIPTKLQLCWPEDSCVNTPTGKCVFCSKPMCDAHADARFWQWVGGMQMSGHACLLCVDEVESQWKVGRIRQVPAPVDKTVRNVRIEKMAVPQPGPARYSLDECIKLQRILEGL